ncbi:hypothetical protein [Jeotgalibaca sp. A127]|uniref:hypothetical protein n=1 Tax=Jeotgalibaca sp. A127 TaxID=3457324 RepID=UPI003FD122FA
MQKKLLVLLSLLPLLTACSSFTGVINQRYGARVIETNEEAVTAYKKSHEIIGEEKEILGAVLPEFFFQEPLDFSGEEKPRSLSTEPLIVGKDVPEGRYTVSKNEIMQSGYLTVLDAEGEVVYRHFLDFSKNAVELNLYEGMQLKANDGYQPRLLMTGVPAVGMTPLEEGQYQFVNGVFHVGEQIEPGEYVFSLPAGYHTSGVNYVYVLETDGSFRVFEMTGDMRDWMDTSIRLTLEAGQVLYVATNSSLTLTRQ